MYMYFSKIIEEKKLINSIADIFLPKCGQSVYETDSLDQELKI